MLISVVMPTYNTDTPVLREAVESVIAQTCGDFEFIIIDDASNNDSVDYLAGLDDARIRIIRNPVNLGITKSLNIGLAAARGKYVARMDSDDVSLPDRFRTQLEYMEGHPDVIVCGCNVERFGVSSGVTKSRVKDMETYRISALFRNPGPVHPTAFFSRELLSRYGIRYDEELVYAQDYGLWVESARHGTVHILPDVLLRYRIHPGQISVSRREVQIGYDLMTMGRLVKELLDTVNGDELRRHYEWSTGYYRTAMCGEAATWFDRLIKANDARHIYDPSKFRDFVYGVVERKLIRDSLPEDASKLKIMRA